jgi:hypothetical protein
MVTGILKKTQKTIFRGKNRGHILNYEFGTENDGGLLNLDYMSLRGPKGRGNLLRYTQESNCWI